MLTLLFFARFNCQSPFSLAFLWALCPRLAFLRRNKDDFAYKSPLFPLKYIIFPLQATKKPRLAACLSPPARPTYVSLVVRLWNMRNGKVLFQSVRSIIRIKKRLSSLLFTLFGSIHAQIIHKMPPRGFEPLIPCGNVLLRHARMPVPPRRRDKNYHINRLTSSESTPFAKEAKKCYNYIVLCG